MSSREMPKPQHTHTTESRSAKTCAIFQLLSCSERCSARSIRDSQLKTGFTLIMLPRIVPLSSTQQMILIVYFMAFLSWRKLVGPRIMRKLWSNTTTGPSAIVCERRVESQLWAAAQRGNPTPEDAKDPMMAPPDCEIRQSGRGLELKTGICG